MKATDGRELSNTPTAAANASVGRPLERTPPPVLDVAVPEPGVRRRDGGTRRRGSIVRRLLVVADTAGIFTAFGIAEAVFHSPTATGRYGSPAEIGLFAASLPGWLLLAKSYGLYDSDEECADHSTADEVFRVFTMLAVGTFGFYILAYLFPRMTEIPLPKILTFLALAVPLVALARSLARGVCRRTDAYIQNTLIFGAGIVGQRVALKLLHHPEYGVNVVGFVDENPRERSDDLGDLTILGKPAELPQIVRACDVQRVIVAFSRDPHADTLEMIRELNEIGVQVDIVPRLFEVIGPHSTIHSAEGLPLMALASARLSRSSLALKRATDIIGSVVGLLVLLPFFALAALAIKLDSPGPVLFRQTRVGRGDRTFRILKFRTMVADADERKQEVAHLNKHRGSDERMFKVDDDPRMTRVGRVLRRRSLDEFPQLINVLRGQMSLVGPRPLIPEEHHHVAGWARRRLDLKPGMTGLWQVLGRDDIPFGEMVGLDYRYVTTWSLANDVRLILMTFAVLVRTNGGGGRARSSAPSRAILPDTSQIGAEAEG